MKGWIYIATMTNTVGVLKIGYTVRDPDTRVAEWGRDTGAPGKAGVQYAALVERPREVETAIHRTLAKYRQLNSEWFQCSVVQAVAALKMHAIPLFEDDRISVAIEAKRLNQERAAQSEKIQLQKDAEKRKTEHEQAKRQAKHQSQLRFREEYQYMKALAKWEASPKSRLLKIITLSIFTLSLLAFISQLLPDSMIVIRPLVVLVFAISVQKIFRHLFSGQRRRKPQLKDYLTDIEGIEVDLSIREKLLATSPTYRGILSGETRN